MAPHIDKMIPLISSLHDKSEDACRTGTLAQMIPNRVWTLKLSEFNRFITRMWRRYGVKLSFIFTFFLMWNGFTLVVVDHDPRVTTESFSPVQTFWLAAFGVVALFIVNFTLPGIVSLLLYTPAREHDEDADVDDQRFTSEHEPVRVILRIVTRGDYPKLIRQNIDFHENLFKNHWRHDLDEIEIHIFTETPLTMARKRVNGAMHRCEVKEFHIPSTYKTPNNTLYKFRNNTFALNCCIETAKSRGESLDRIWVISLDEDVFLTPEWLSEFASSVLEDTIYGDYKFVNSPSRPIFVDANDGIGARSLLPPIVPFFGEAFRFAMDISRVWWQAKLFGRGAVGMRGSCYGIRLDIEERIGYDYGGPYLSVGDDTTFLHRLMMTPDVKTKFLDAWFLEGAPNSAFEFMKQRARWVRNHLYFLIFSDIPLLKKARLASFLITWTIIMPAAMLVFSSGYLLAFANHRLIDFFPAGPAWPISDAISCLSLACVMYWYIYGCAFLLPWYWAVLVSLTFSTYLPVVPLHAVGSIAAVWGLLGAAYELISGAANFAVTEKKAT